MAYFAAHTWVKGGLKVCCTRIEVLVERSGCIVLDNHRSEPIILYICWRSVGVATYDKGGLGMTPTG